MNHSTSERDIPKPAAANAITHGFTAAKFVSDEIAERAEALRRELTQIHEPQTHGEVDCLAELALARARQYELELALSRLVRTEKDRAAELYDRRAQALFEEDFTRWTTDPARFTRIFTSNYLGADYVARLWSGIVADLAPEGPGLTAAQARKAAASLGCCWQVSKARDDGAWLMARFVRVSPDTDAALAQWVADSGTPDDTLARARWHLKQAPDRQTSWQELAIKATAEKDRWSLHAKTLRSRYETERALAADAAIGLGIGDKNLEKRLRLTQRYLTTARNRADRLERRLDGLKKGRLMAAYRAERASRDFNDTYEPIAKRMEPIREAALDTGRYPAYAKRDENLHLRDIDHHAINGENHFDRTSPVPAHDPLACADLEVPQTSMKQEDATYLRNETTAEFSAEPKDNDDTFDPSESAEADAMIDAATAGDERAAETARKLRRVRFLNWRDPDEIDADAARLLVKLMQMPPSLPREAVLRATFGTETVLRRAFRKYSSWAPAETEKVCADLIDQLELVSSAFRSE